MTEDITETGGGEEVGDLFHGPYNPEIEDPIDLRIVKLEDDSMEPVIRPGDRVVIDPELIQPETGDIFLLRDGGELVARRVEVIGEEASRVRLIADNPDYPPRECLARDAHLLGKAVWVISRV